MHLTSLQEQGIWSSGIDHIWPAGTAMDGSLGFKHGLLALHGRT